MNLLRRIIRNQDDDASAAALQTNNNNNNNSSISARILLSKAKEKATAGLNVDIHDNLGQLEHDIQSNAEKFDPKKDRAFAWLQWSVYYKQAQLHQK